MLKRPEHSKRRVAAQLGPLADELAALLLNCALEDLANWTGSVCLAPATSADLGWAEGLLRDSPGRRYVMPQQGGNLGQRIKQVDALLRAQGETNIIMLGTDCPAINSAYLKQAAAALTASDIVLGPARDGGVVLMGSATPWPDLARLPWSTAKLRKGLLKLCTTAGLTVTQLKPRSDVDTSADACTLGAQLATDTRRTRRDLLAWVGDHREQLSVA